MKREMTCLWLGKESRGQSAFAVSSLLTALHLLLPPQSLLKQQHGQPWNVPAEFQGLGCPVLPQHCCSLPKTRSERSSLVETPPFLHFQSPQVVTVTHSGCPILQQDVNYCNESQPDPRPRFVGIFFYSPILINYSRIWVPVSAVLFQRAILAAQSPPPHQPQHRKKVSYLSLRLLHNCAPATRRSER